MTTHSSNHDSHSELYRRIKKLERQVRWFQVFIFCAFAIAGTTLLTAQVQPERQPTPVPALQSDIPQIGNTVPPSNQIVEAAGFAVKDAAGITRAQIGMQADRGAPFMALADEYGVIRMMLVLDGGEPQIVMRDGDQNVRMTLGSQAKGETYSVGMYTRDQSDRAMLYASESGSGFEAGNPRGEYVGASVTPGQNVSGSVSLNGNPMTAVLGMDQSQVKFQILDRNGRPIFERKTD